jgi:hypothetical protein
MRSLFPTIYATSMMRPTRAKATTTLRRLARAEINKVLEAIEVNRPARSISLPRRLSLKRPRDQPRVNRPCLRNKHAREHRV